MFHYKKTQKGFATLAMSVALLIAMTTVSFYASQSVITGQRIYNNTYNSNHAFNAAQAGIGHGISYLNENKSTITDGQVINGTMTNGHSYTVTYTFVGGTNQVIKITSVGTYDTNSTKTIAVYAKTGAPAANRPEVTILSKGEAEFEGNAKIYNILYQITVKAGDEVEFENNAQTYLASGPSSNASNMDSDIIHHNGGLSGMSNSDFETLLVGKEITAFQGDADITYSNSSSHNYNSELNGVMGKVIYLTQTSGSAQINGNTIIGTPDSPVLIVVDGSVSISGNATIHGSIISTKDISMNNSAQINGMVFGMGEVELEGSVEVNGMVAAGNELELEGNAIARYDPITIYKSFSIKGDYGIVKGSWIDY